MAGKTAGTQKKRIMRTILKLCPVGLSLSMLLLCSCATTPHHSGVTASSPERPADVTMNKDAGCGGHLYVTLRLDRGEEAPFFVDSGAPITLLDKSLEPTLGKCLDTDTFWNFGDQYECRRYAAPKLYLGNTRLLTDSNAVTTDLIGKMSARLHRPILGILGIDCCSTTASNWTSRPGGCVSWTPITSRRPDWARHSR